MRTYSCVQNLRISFCGWICPEKVFSARTQSSWSTYCQLTICHLQTLLGWYWNSVQMVKRLKLANFGLTIWGLVVLSDTCIRHHPIHASYQLFCESLREIDVNDGIVNVPEMPRLCCSYLKSLVVKLQAASCRNPDSIAIVGFELEMSLQQLCWRCIHILLCNLVFSTNWQSCSQGKTSLPCWRCQFVLARNIAVSFCKKTTFTTIQFPIHGGQRHFGGRGKGSGRWRFDWCGCWVAVLGFCVVGLHKQFCSQSWFFPCAPWPVRFRAHNCYCTCNILKPFSTCSSMALETEARTLICSDDPAVTKACDSPRLPDWKPPCCNINDCDRIWPWCSQWIPFPNHFLASLQWFSKHCACKHVSGTLQFFRLSFSSQDLVLKAALVVFTLQSNFRSSGWWNPCFDACYTSFYKFDCNRSDLTNPFSRTSSFALGFGQTSHFSCNRLQSLWLQSWLCRPDWFEAEVTRGFSAVVTPAPQLHALSTWGLWWTCCT